MDDNLSSLTWIDHQLPALRDELCALSNINSGSLNAAGVDAVAERLKDRFVSLEPAVETLVLATRGAAPIGKALRLRKRPDAPLQIFLGGHLDTVFGIDHPFQVCRSLGDDHLNGPGVADLKGGLLVLWLALSALERSPFRDRIGWEVLLNPDEEIGSAASAFLLAEAATRNHLGLVYEPAYADGNLASSRKGSGNFEVQVHGRTAHAGRNPEHGRNAVVAAADLIGRIQALNGQREGLTINPAFIHGGGALNVVPDACSFQFNVRTQQVEDEAWLHEQLANLLVPVNAAEGFAATLSGGFTRPPKIFDARHQRLAGMIADCGRQLNLSLEFHPTGGCCDGNNLAAHGLPNIDNLGVVGGDIHTDREWMRVSSLAERGKLSALLLLRLASGELSWE